MENLWEQAGLEQARSQRRGELRARYGSNWPLEQAESLDPLPDADPRACPVRRVASTPRAAQALSHHSDWREHRLGPFGHGRILQEPWWVQAQDLIASEHARAERLERERQEREARARELASKYNR